MTSGDPSHPGPYVFLSYASADRETAFRVADALEGRGISVWIDRKSIAGGTSWSGEIARGIEGCAAQVLLCSVKALASPNVQQEVQLAWESRRPILPLWLEVVQLPGAIRYVLAGRQRIDLLDHPVEEWLPRVVEALAGLGVPIPPAQSPGDQSSSEPSESSSGGPSASALLGNRASATPALADGAAVAPDRTNLPATTTVFIGREREVAEIRQLLTHADVRLVTLTGPGGVGKTRLALEVARQVRPAFPDGVIYVPLAAVGDPELVAPTIARVLGVRESPARPLRESLQIFLRDQSALLLLDNFEQVAAAVSVIGELLTSCPHLKVLVTSRSVLRAYGENEYVVEPLAVPDPLHRAPLEQLGQAEAVQLFVARARAVKSDFALTPENADAVAAICVRLEGLPLAIELAAARVRLFSPAALLARLDRQLAMLTGGAKDVPVRQQTMRGAIAWSYDLLDDAEKALFRRLCVFVGSFDLASAELIVPAGGSLDVDLVDGLESLVAKSLVRSRESTGEPRFGLFETIREFGRERLRESGEEETIRTAHAAYYLTFAEGVGARLEGTDFAAKVERLALADENLRAAFTFFADHQDAERSLRLAIALADAAYGRGTVREGRERLSRALALARPPDLPGLRADALSLTARFSWMAFDSHGVEVAGRPALELYRALGRKSEAAQMLLLLGSARHEQGDYAGEVALTDEALAIQRQLDDPARLCFTLMVIANNAIDREDLATGRAFNAEALALARRLGIADYVGYVLWNVTREAIVAGDLERARATANEGLALVRRTNAIALVPNFDYLLAYFAVMRGDLAEARRLGAEGLEIARARDHPLQLIAAVNQFALLALATGETERGNVLAAAFNAASQASHVALHPAWQTLLRHAGIPLERPADPAQAAAWDRGRAMSLDEALVYAQE